MIEFFSFFLQKGVKQICATYGTGNNEPISYLYMNLDFFFTRFVNSFNTRFDFSFGRISN